MDIWRKKTIEIGQEIWYEDTYGNIQSGEVTGFHEGTDYVKIRGTRSSHGSQGVKVTHCYPTKDELLTGMRVKSQKRTSAFCEEIKIVNDLVRFMYDHTVSCAEEYTDWDARKAAAIRAKELLGIDLG